MRLQVTLAVLAAATAQAGTTAVFERTDDTGTSHTMTFKVDGEKLRTDVADEKQTLMIWDGAAKVMIHGQAADKSYARLDEPRLKAMKAQMATMQEAMKARMENMPPEQRAQMEEMMKGMHGDPNAKPPEPWKFTAAGAKRTVGQFTCEVYHATRGDDSKEVCVVPWAKAPLTREDTKAFVSMGEFFASIMGDLAKRAPVGEDLFSKQLHQYPGFPVQTVSSRDGKQHTMSLKSVTRGAIDASAFVVPADYTEKEPPMMMGPPPGMAPRGMGRPPK